MEEHKMDLLKASLKSGGFQGFVKYYCTFEEPMKNIIQEIMQIMTEQESRVPIGNQKLVNAKKSALY